MSEPTLHRVIMTMCSLCLDGAGGECHVGGCALWINRAPDLSLRDSPMVESIDGAQMDYETLKRRPAPETTTAVVYGSGTPTVISCSFCEKSCLDVRKMVATGPAAICNECIDLCNDIVAEQVADETDTPTALDNAGAVNDIVAQALADNGAMRSTLTRVGLVVEAAVGEPGCGACERLREIEALLRSAP